ncbi:MAG: hypothetical protein ACQESR_29870 [Planctomycetota bacterium]
MKKLAICMTLLALGTITFAGCNGATGPADPGGDAPETETDDMGGGGMGGDEMGGGGMGGEDTDGDGSGDGSGDAEE